MNINECFPSSYLKAADFPLNQDAILTMHSVRVEKVGGNQNPDEQKPVLYFHETDKGLVLNVTNAKTIEVLYGPETTAWSNRQISLFTMQTEFQGKPTMAIRVRMQAPQQQQVAQTQPPIHGIAQQQQPGLIQQPGFIQQPVMQTAPVATADGEQDPFADDHPNVGYNPVPAQTAQPMQQPVQQQPVFAQQQPGGIPSGQPVQNQPLPARQ